MSHNALRFFDVGERSRGAQVQPLADAENGPEKRRSSTIWPNVTRGPVRIPGVVWQSGEFAAILCVWAPRSTSANSHVPGQFSLGPVQSAYVIKGRIRLLYTEHELPADALSRRALVALFPYDNYTARQYAIVPAPPNDQAVVIPIDPFDVGREFDVGVRRGHLSECAFGFGFRFGLIPLHTLSCVKVNNSNPPTLRRTVSPIAVRVDGRFSPTRRPLLPHTHGPYPPILVLSAGPDPLPLGVRSPTSPRS